MPLARYFLFVGAALLALLFGVNAFLPSLPVADNTETVADLPVIRIHTDRKWPERVVFDTRVPAMAAAAPVVTAKTDAPRPVSAAAADTSTKTPVLDALAQLTPSEPKQIEPSAPKKPQPPQHKRKIVKSRVGPPPIVLFAQQPRFGFFANNNNFFANNTW
jgi:hypothetical protein